MSHFDVKVTQVQRIIDGDTFDFEVDLGFHTRTVKRYRLAGINTAEVWGSNAEEVGKIQRDWVEDWIDRVFKRGSLRIRTFRLDWSVPLSDGGFGRWAAIVYDAGTLEFLSDALVAEGFEKQGELLYVWDSVKEIQEEMAATYGESRDIEFELTSDGELRPIDA